jgi:hypothetical protein
MKPSVPNVSGAERKIRPHCPSASTRYSRLFPPSEDAVDSHQLSKLGKSMMSADIPNGNPIPPGFRGQTNFAGYTYFGQFIGHDLTWDQTPLDQAGKLSPSQTTNHRTPWLDLDHLYGSGPESSDHRHLYEKDRASFRLGDVALANGQSFDVPLDESGNPDLPDPRNGENLIIRQLHAMFLKLHNAAIRELPVTLPADERFERARNRVCWQYQWLVRNDFLPLICKRTIVEEVLAGRRAIDWNQDGFSIPIEFAHAAFRFGHSMVRAKYILNPSIAGTRENGASWQSPEEVDLLAILTEARNRRPLSVRRAIDWRKFLRDPVAPERSRGIDTGIAEGFVIPHKIPSELPVLTLLRGAAMQLATGEQVSGILRTPFPVISSGEVAAYNRPPYKHPSRELFAYGFAGTTPLWYYFLLEAQLEEHGSRLGSAGSWIVAEVIEGSLRADPNSFLSRVGAEWEPPPWKAPGGKPFAIRTLFDVAVVTGLANRP